MDAGIYKISHAASGRAYVGSAVNIKKRWATHRHALRTGRHHSQKLQRAWSKYGEAEFCFDVLLVCAPGDLLFYEQRVIDGWGTVKGGFNVRPTAGNSLGMPVKPVAREKIRAALTGIKRSDETREKMRLVRTSPAMLKRMRVAHLGRKNSPETIEKMRAAAAGRVVSEETKEKLRAANLGRPVPLDARAKISEALKGRPKSEATKARMRAAQQRRAAA